MITTEQILAFAEAINKGRAAFDLPPVETWEVTVSSPNRGTSCLSARHLIGPIIAGEAAPCHVSVADGYVDSDAFQLESPERGKKLCLALWGPEAVFDEEQDTLIPEAIRNVTDPFDRLGDLKPSAYDAALEEWRDAFIAAGLDAS